MATTDIMKYKAYVISLPTKLSSKFFWSEMEFMNKRTLYLHIGCEKTGTTSIQNVLADNRQALLLPHGDAR